MAVLIGHDRQSIAGAILDRLVDNAYRFELTGKSMPKQRSVSGRSLGALVRSLKGTLHSCGAGEPPRVAVFLQSEGLAKDRVSGLSHACAFEGILERRQAHAAILKSINFESIQSKASSIGTIFPMSELM